MKQLNTIPDTAYGKVHQVGSPEYELAKQIIANPAFRKSRMDYEKAFEDITNTVLVSSEEAVNGYLMKWYPELLEKPPEYMMEWVKNKRLRCGILKSPPKEGEHKQLYVSCNEDLSDLHVAEMGYSIVTCLDPKNPNFGNPSVAFQHKELDFPPPWVKEFLSKTPRLEEVNPYESK